MGFYFDNTLNRYRVEIDKRRPDGTRMRKTKLLPRGISEAKAQAIADKMETDLVVRNELTTPLSGWSEYVDQMVADRKSWLYKTVAGTKSRARKRNGSSGLTALDIRALLLRSAGRCEVTGIAFHTNAEMKRNPFAPSIDRIDSSGGYSMSNCRVVCYAVNIAMLHWGEEVFGQVATGWVINKYTTFALVSRLRV